MRVAILTTFAASKKEPLVRELDRSFVPDIEKAAGQSRAWYQPA